MYNIYIYVYRYIFINNEAFIYHLKISNISTDSSKSTTDFYKQKV